MKLILCDDEKNARLWAEQAIKNWAIEREDDIDLIAYTSAEAMLFNKDAWADGDGLILDIELGNMNGMQLAKEIRKSDVNIPILFVTGYERFVFEGYDVGAVSYLLKPVSEVKLFESLDRLKTMSTKNREFILIEWRNALEKVYLTDILYIESDRHNSLIQTIKKRLTASNGIGQFEAELTEKGFCLSHRSYLVNIARIRKITKTVVVLDNDYEVPIARGKWAYVNQKYLDFYRKGKL